jgi:hypothetical protein
MQLRETEHLKQELTKSKDSSNFSRLYDSDIPSIYKYVKTNIMKLDLISNIFFPSFFSK